MNNFILKPCRNKNGTNVIALSSTDRPGWSLETQKLVMDDFLKSKYATTTSLADFLKAHSDCKTKGVLDSLHRRHIIPWASILNFLLYQGLVICGDTDSNGMIDPEIEALLSSLGVAQTGLQSLGTHEAVLQYINNAAKTAYSCYQNVFIGPGNYNTRLGAIFDKAADMDSVVRNYCLAGKITASSTFKYFQIRGGLIFLISKIENELGPEFRFANVPEKRFRIQE